MIENPTSPKIYPLWEGQETPYYKKNNLKEYEKEAWGTLCVFDVTEPTMSVYAAQGENSGIGVIIAPGGGYEAEGIYLEGHDLAKKLVKAGITSAVLKYRLPNPQSSDKPHLVPFADARQSLKLFRQLSDVYGLNKEKIGFVGFSAGSHLAAATSLWVSDYPEENPNFSGYFYGASSISPENVTLFEQNIFHRKMTQEEINQYDLVNLVCKNTPPAFLIHAYDDDLVPFQETTLFAKKLNENNVQIEVHLFSKGGHGFGIGRKEDGTSQWVQIFVNWVKRL